MGCGPGRSRGAQGRDGPCINWILRLARYSESRGDCPPASTAPRGCIRRGAPPERCGSSTRPSGASGWPSGCSSPSARAPRSASRISISSALLLLSYDEPEILLSSSHPVVSIVLMLDDLVHRCLAKGAVLPCGTGPFAVAGVGDALVPSRSAIPNSASTGWAAHSLSIQTLSCSLLKPDCPAKRVPVACSSVHPPSRRRAASRATSPASW